MLYFRLFASLTFVNSFSKSTGDLNGSDLTDEFYLFSLLCDLMVRHCISFIGLDSDPVKVVLR